MSLLDIAAILVVLAAGFSYLNHRTLRLPPAVGVMLSALLASLAMIALSRIGVDVGRYAERLFERVDFSETLMHGMLSFLLFAGALKINLNDLARQKGVVATLASVGTVLSAAIVGLALWALTDALGLGLPLTYCLLFGALIAPTDPVAVLAILKSAGAPKSLETKIAGESLFNDGIAVVLFIVLLRLATGAADFGPAQVLALFLLEAVGGAAFGLALGWIAYRLIRQVDDYQLEVLLTLALVMGGYAAANALHLSGPIAIVVAGLLIGNHGRRLAMSARTREHLDSFWELLDELFNAVLFVLIGLEVLVLVFTREYLLAGLLAVALVLLARFISVGLPVGVLRRYRPFSPHVVTILTWSGLRGGISVALALSLPAGEARDAVVAMTYVVVVFSIVVQGLTVGWLVRRLLGAYVKRRSAG